MINTLLNLALLAFSLLGWAFFVQNKWRIQPAFLMIFIFSSITCILFMAGLLNIMPLMVNVIYYFGLVLCGIYIYLIIKRKYEVKILIVPSIFFFLIFFVYVILILRGTIYVHYDNFSHWGLIVKEMYKLNGLPDGTTMVSFENYPPGSAVFIYFILKTIGYTESIALMSQGFLVGASLTVLFVFCDWKRPIHLILVIVSCITLLLVRGDSLYNLLVDILLGTVALSTTIIAYYYRENWRKSLLVNTPLLILLLLVKDSGKIFLIINVALMISFLCMRNFRGIFSNYNKVKVLALVFLCTIILPMSTNYLWLKYTEKAYHSSYEENKFAISSETIKELDKSEEVIAGIGHDLVLAAINVESSYITSLLLLNGLSILTIAFDYFRNRRVSKMLLRVTLFVNLIYIVYMFLLYLMYVYLMPEHEAVRLAGLNRYQSTIIIYCTGILMMTILLEWDKWVFKTKSITLKTVLVFSLTIIFIYPYSGNMKLFFQKPDVISTIRWEVHNSFEKIAKSGSNEPRVVYYSPNSKEDRGYLSYVLRYEQLSNNFSIVNTISTDEDREKLLESIKGSDFFVVIDIDKQMNEFLRKYDITKKSEGVFQIVTSGGQLRLSPLD